MKKILVPVLMLVALAGCSSNNAGCHEAVQKADLLIEAHKIKENIGAEGMNAINNRDYAGIQDARHDLDVINAAIEEIEVQYEDAKRGCR